MPVCVAMGYSHSQWLTAEGVIYSAGQNSYGQCGTGSKANATTPQRSTLPDTKPVRFIEAAYYHSVAITVNDEFLVCGYNGHGQLGDGTTSGETLTYKPVQALNRLQIASVMRCFLLLLNLLCAQPQTSPHAGHRRLLLQRCAHQNGRAVHVRCSALCSARLSSH